MAGLLFWLAGVVAGIGIGGYVAHRRRARTAMLCEVQGGPDDGVLVAITARGQVLRLRTLQGGPFRHLAYHKDWGKEQARKYARELGESLLRGLTRGARIDGG